MSVIVCVPAERRLVEKEPPVPICPLMLLDQTSDDPASTPSSGSNADPLKLTLEPVRKFALLAGVDIVAEGA